jgi:hypothetical protein
VLWRALACAAPGQRGRLRLGRAALVIQVSLATVVVLSLPWLELPDSLDPLLNETAGVGYVNAVPDQLMLLLAEHFGALSDTAVPARVLERLLSLLVFGLYLGWEARRVWQDRRASSIVGATARSSLIYVLLVSTSLQPWYFALPLALALLLGLRSRLAQVTLAYALLALPTLYLSYYLRELVPGIVWLIYGGGPLLLLLGPWRTPPPAWQLSPGRVSS